MEEVNNLLSKIDNEYNKSKDTFDLVNIFNKKQKIIYDYVMENYYLKSLLKCNEIDFLLHICNIYNLELEYYQIIDTMTYKVTNIKYRSFEPKYD